LSMLISVGMFHERFTVRRAIASVLVLAALFLAE
jgi:drug/metabolite transporter (DMT)-like permease